MANQEKPLLTNFTHTDIHPKLAGYGYVPAGQAEDLGQYPVDLLTRSYPGILKMPPYIPFSPSVSLEAPLRTPEDRELETIGLVKPVAKPAEAPLPLQHDAHVQAWYAEEAK